MRRPLAGMGIALVAGVIAAAFGRNGLFFLPAVWVIGIMIILWTDSSFTYVLGLSVFFIVGFCRMMAQEKDPSEFDGNIQGTGKGTERLCLCERQRRQGCIGDRKEGRG